MRTVASLIDSEIPSAAAPPITPSGPVSPTRTA